MKLFSKRTTSLVKLSCAKQRLYRIVERHREAVDTTYASMIFLVNGGMIGVQALLPPGGQRFLVESDMVPNLYISPSRSGVVDSSRARSFLPLGLPTSSIAQCARTMRPRARERDATFSIPSAGMQREELRCGTIQVAVSNSGTHAGRLDGRADCRQRTRHACRSVRSDSSVTRAS